MEQQRKTLLRVTPGEKDPLLIGLDQLLTNLPFEECRLQIERIIETAVPVCDENTALRWLTVYQTAVYNTSSDLAQKYGRISYFRAFLKNLFWLLPSDGASYSPFFPTKQYILEQIIEEWDPDFCSPSLDVFRFLIATYGNFKSPVLLQEETVWEKKARERFVAEKTKKMVLDVIREWIAKRGFEAYQLEQWIMEPRVPSEILKLLEHAWVRVASGEYVARHLKRSLKYTGAEVE